MNRPPEPPPEGVLIEQARNQAKLSVREAARRAGISEGWWRQVAKGYQSLSGGAFGIVRDVPADTVAKMAKAAGVKPEQMETEGRRPDAARILREINRQEEERTAPRPAAVIEFGEEDLPDDEYTPEEQAALQDYADEFKLRVARARRRHPGERLTGLMVFPRDALYQQMWDALSQLGWKPEGLPRAMAAMMVDREDLSAGRTGTGHAAGLTAVRVT